ncbi:MAG: hypothetical protein JO054_13530 [Actinobacteria bacterium]|nr:hypothetical protein [Actinomycetota bacterium]
MAHAEAQEEPTRERLLQRTLGVGHREGVTGVDVGDAGGDLQLGRRAEQQRGGDERVAGDRLGDPQRGEPKLLDASGELLRLRRRDGVQCARPDPNSSDVDRLSSHVASLAPLAVEACDASAIEPAAHLATELGIEPLTARSLILSTLLGTHPPHLPVRALVAVGELFGFAEGTVRTALSRMATAGEVDADNGRYALGERLRKRQASQDASRRPPPNRWDGAWWIAHVVAEGRSVGDRREFRARMRDAHMGELKPDVWLRPANIAGPEPSADVLLTRGSIEDRDPVELATQLWDLDNLRHTGKRLRRAADHALTSLAAGDASVLPDTFMTSVAVVRYLLAEPQLPAELAGDGWPAIELRGTYDELERAHGRVLSDFLAQAMTGT